MYVSYTGIKNKTKHKLMTAISGRNKSLDFFFFRLDFVVVVVIYTNIRFIKYLIATSIYIGCSRYGNEINSNNRNRIFKF